MTERDKRQPAFRLDLGRQTTTEYRVIATVQPLPGSGEKSKDVMVSLYSERRHAEQSATLHRNEGWQNVRVQQRKRTLILTAWEDVTDA